MLPIVDLVPHRDRLVIDADDEILETRRAARPRDFAMGNAAGNQREIVRMNIVPLVDELQPARAGDSYNKVGIEMEMEAHMFHHMVAQRRDIEVPARFVDVLEMAAQHMIAERSQIGARRGGCGNGRGLRSKFFINLQSIFTRELFA